jgi:hypothetical protein
MESAVQRSKLLFAEKMATPIQRRKKRRRESELQTAEQLFQMFTDHLIG